MVIRHVPKKPDLLGRQELDGAAVGRGPLARRQPLGDAEVRERQVACSTVTDRYEPLDAGCGGLSMPPGDAEVRQRQVAWFDRHGPLHASGALLCPCVCGIQGAARAL